MSVTHPDPETDAAATKESFRPIAEYGLLADCNSAALVDLDGSIGWLCLPRYDSPAVFAQILDREGGHWQIRPSTAYRSERHYVPGTLVIETTFATESGSVKLTDAMVFGANAASRWRFRSVTCASCAYSTRTSDAAKRAISGVFGDDQRDRLAAEPDLVVVQRPERRTFRRHVVFVGAVVARHVRPVAGA